MNSDRHDKKPLKNDSSARQKTAAEVREERLKAALKANMGRRKAQAKARTGQNIKET